VTAAGTAIADPVVTAVSDIRTAAGQPLPANQMTQMPNSLTMTTPARAKVGKPHSLVTTATKHANAELGTSHPMLTTATKHANAEPGRGTLSGTLVRTFGEPRGALSRKPPSGLIALCRADLKLRWSTCAQSDDQYVRCASHAELPQDRKCCFEVSALSGGGAYTARMSRGCHIDGVQAGAVRHAGIICAGGRSSRAVVA
jgi:hypothetical protein